MSPRPALFALALAGAASSGCATLTGIFALAGSLPSTSTHETVTPLGARERRSEVTAELSPLRVRCVLQERAARERVRLDTHGIDAVGRLTYGFIGVGEAGVAAALWYGAVGLDEPSVGLGVLAGIATLDAIATMVLAFALPNHRRVEEVERAGTWRAATCPGDLRITFAGRDLPLDPTGHLRPGDEQWLLGQWVSLGAAAEVRVGGRSQPLTPSVEQRCLWARGLGMREADALCARPAVAATPVGVTAPTMGVPPLQVTIDLGVSLP